MSEREDVEAGVLEGVLGVIETALAEILKDPDGRDPAWEALWIGDELKPLLVTHDEQVRAEVLAPVRALAEEWEAEALGVEQDGTPEAEVEAFMLTGCAVALLAALPPERLAGEVGAE